MCGLVAIFAYSDEAPSIDRDELLRIRERMHLRGPDGSGLWISGNRRVGLGHRRLSIIDTSEAANQPMVSSDGSLQIVYNGEIYNYQELRAELIREGCIFRTTSDTEVLLELYRKYGEDMVHKLRGMFAFAIWDEKRSRLFLARDTFGIKPLYIADDGRSIRVASQVKALLAGGQIDTNPEPAGHTGFFLWGHVPDPFTLYRGIRALPSGCTLVVNSKGAETHKVFDSVNSLLRKTPVQLSPKQRKERIRTALLDSVEHHLVADVPVGVFLSAGLDSSTLVALATELKSEQLKTSTLGFEEYRSTDNDETLLAAETAQHYGTNHSTHWVSQKDFEDELENIFEAMDQPSIDGINTYFVAKATKQSGLKVAISGVGADELFGGYGTFRDVPKLVHLTNWIPGSRYLGRGMRKMSQSWIGKLTSPKWAGIIEYGSSFAGAYLLRRSLFMPWELKKQLPYELVREGLDILKTEQKLEEEMAGIEDSMPKISVMEMTFYMRNQLLRDNDWAGMAHSLEIRVPFVDRELISALQMTATGKPLSKKDLAASPSTLLPSGIIGREKTGFSIPVTQWVAPDSIDSLSAGHCRFWAKKVLNNQT